MRRDEETDADRSSDKWVTARHQEIAEVVDAICDGYAIDADYAHLSQIIKKDRSALRYYVECVGMHSALDWLVTSREPFEFADQGGPGESEVSQDRKRNLTIVLHRSSALLALAASIAAIGWFVNGWKTAIPLDVVALRCASITRSSNGAHWSVLNAKGSPTMQAEIMAGETIHLTKGDVLLEFGDGAEVNLTAPAVLQVVGVDRALAVRGKLTALVGEEAIGFSIDTPRAQVIDLGTRFGLEVDDLGQTDVVVFEGEVDIAYGPVETHAVDWKRRVMRMGEAVRVDGRGDANRIISISSDRFVPAAEGTTGDGPEPAIIDVRDNIRGDESWNYYEVVRGGMREDARAFVDRIEHEWNGLDVTGMPEYLVGGDYLRMFNNDKWAKGFELEVKIARPATLYVLFDDRVQPPHWLLEGFVDTGDDIGLDRGPFHNLNGKLNNEFSSGVGPGVSVEDTLSVWSRVVDHPEVIRLGDTQSTHSRLNMYGVVAVPIADSHP